MKKLLSTLLGALIVACLTVASLPIGNAVVNADEKEPELPIYNITIDDSEPGGYIIPVENEEPVTLLDAGSYIFPGQFRFTFKTASGDPSIQEVKLSLLNVEMEACTLDDYKNDVKVEWDLTHVACVESIVKSPDGKTLNVNIVPAYYVYVGAVSGNIEFGLTPEEHDDYFENIELVDATMVEDEPYFHGGGYTTNPEPVLKIGAGRGNRLMGVFFDEEVGIDNCFGNNFYDVAEFADEAGFVNVFVDAMEVKLFDIRWNNFDSAEREGDYVASEEHLDHGSCRIVAIYEEQDDGSLEDVTTLYGDFVSKDGAVDSDGYGDILVQEGHIIEFEFIPQRGYQLKTVLANGFPLEAQDDIPNHYLYQMPGTNIHFTATFEKVDDKVVSDDSKAIKSGEITFGDDEFSGGSAQVEITDTKQFSKSLDTGYEMVASMEIKAYNVFDKANSDGDMWKLPVTDLESDAKLTLQTSAALTLEDGDKVYLAHDHDGELEYLECTISPETGEITTSKVGGFSEFAIVIKKAELKTTTTPEVTTTPAPASVVSTGESTGTTYLFGALFIAAACAMFVSVRTQKKED